MLRKTPPNNIGALLAAMAEGAAHFHVELEKEARLDAMVLTQSHSANDNATKMGLFLSNEQDVADKPVVAPKAKATLSYDKESTFLKNSSMMTAKPKTTARDFLASTNDIIETPVIKLNSLDHYERDNVIPITGRKNTFTYTG